jgi:hypothetical protein
MALPIKDIFGILEDNLRLRGTVMPLSRARQTAWARGLNLPRGGSRVIYTGHMYQMMPAIADLDAWLGRLENTLLTKFMGLGRLANRFINLSAFMTWPSSKNKTLYDSRLRRIAQSLTAAGISYGYLYEQEFYAGALVYDLGGEASIRQHAARVWKRLQALGVTSVITVDPHTTEMLREIFPKYLPDYQLEVKSWLEVLAESGWVGKSGEEKVAIHDSCVYARGLDLVVAPRTLLDKAKLPGHSPDYSGRGTHCCGGPAESLFPRRAEAVAQERMAQLAATGCTTVVAMCPICQHNLQKAAKLQGMIVKDMAEVLE